MYVYIYIYICPITSLLFICALIIIITKTKYGNSKKRELPSVAATVYKCPVVADFLRTYKRLSFQET